MNDLDRPARPFSPSQISDKRLCFRRWGWAKLDGLPVPQKDSAAFGDRVHGILERWLREGHPIPPDTDEGAVALSGIPYLPEPGPRLNIETRIQLITDVATYNGRVDLDYDDEPDADERDLLAKWHAGEAFTRIPVVHDHKTTGNMAWAKTPEDLRTDPQAVIYGAERMARTGFNVVRLQWLYMLTGNKRKARRVRLAITRAEVEASLPGIDADAAEMHDAHARGLRALDLPPDPRACAAFGGCPFVSNCNLTPHEKIGALMAQQESLMQRLARERGTAGPGAQPPVAPAPAPGPAATAMAAPVPLPAPAPLPAHTPITPGAAAGSVAARMAARGVAPSGVLPPEAGLPATAPATPAPSTPAAAPAPAPAPYTPPAMAPIVLDGKAAADIVAAIYAAAQKIVPRDFRDDLVLAIVNGLIIQGADVEKLGPDIYRMADEILKGR